MVRLCTPAPSPPRAALLPAEGRKEALPPGRHVVAGRQPAGLWSLSPPASPTTLQALLVPPGHGEDPALPRLCCPGLPSWPLGDTGQGRPLPSLQNPGPSLPCFRWPVEDKVIFPCSAWAHGGAERQAPGRVTECGKWMQVADRAPQWPPSTQARESLPASWTIHIREGLASLAAAAQQPPCGPAEGAHLTDG